MKVEIFSREAIQVLIDGFFPNKTAVISFYSPSLESERITSPWIIVENRSDYSMYAHMI